MSSERAADDAAGGGDERASADRADDPARLRAEVELLAEENQRLREEYATVKQTQYRRLALGLAGLGVVAALGGVLFADARSVLFALGGTGLFLGLLTYYLSPEQFLPASIGRSVYATLARNEADAVAELGLSEARVYVPVGTDEVRLFVPQREEYRLPAADALDDVFVATDDDTRGVALAPTGAGLADEFERAVADDAGDDLGALAERVADALVEQFELVDAASADADPDADRVTVAVSGSVYGDVDRFDHPVVSFAATVLARRFDAPVEATADPADERASHRLTFRRVDKP